MDKYIIAPPSGSTNNSVGAVDRHWQKGYFDELPNWQEYLAESTGYGIVSGCTPSISGLTVTVASGVVHLANGTRKEISASAVTLDAADPTNPRIDLVYIDSTGVVSKVTGTAVASPSAPTLPTGGISVAQVSVAANDTTGTVADTRGMLARWYNSGIVNVKDFGAIGNGTADDTDAIQSAIDNGSVIIIPDGKYKITKDIKIRSNRKIILNGEIVSIGYCLAFYDANNPVYGYNGVHDVVLEGYGTFNASGDVAYNTTSPLRLYHCKNIIIKDITIANQCVFHAIEIGSCKNIEIKNVKIPTYFNQTGYSSTGEAIQIEICENDAGQSGGGYFDSTPVDNVKIIGCTIGTENGGLPMGVGIHSGGDDNKYNNIQIISNTFATKVFGVRIQYCVNNLYIIDNYFTQNNADNHYSAGISAYNAKNCWIENNKIEKVQSYGIMVSGVSNTIVRDNTLVNCIQFRDLQGAWLQAAGINNGLLVTGNLIVVEDATSYPIVFYLNNPSDSKVVFQDNYVKGLSLWSLSDLTRFNDTVATWQDASGQNADFKIY